MRNKSEKEMAREHRASPECTALVPAYKNLARTKLLRAKRPRRTIGFIAAAMVAYYAIMFGDTGKDKAER